LAPKLHALLRRHFAGDPTIEVMVERRVRDRRDNTEPRQATERRVGERRAPAVPVGVPDLPRRARPWADNLVFVERLEPSGQQLEDDDTARLVARIQAGEKGLFARLYTRYFDRVYAYLRLLLADPHRAEDVTQQVFISVLEALPRYERRHQPFRAWLFVIARNGALNELKRQRLIEYVDPVDLEQGHSDLEHGHTGPLALPVDHSLAALGWISDRELLMLMQRLPPPQQQVLMLRYALDLSHADTATVLGRSPEDVRVLQHRALGFLRQRLVSLGRESPSRHSTRMRRVVRHAPVLRRRRFALL
jgi:RNA polymerase sigma-70 factor (ECF subfamily)